MSTEPEQQNKTCVDKPMAQLKLDSDTQDKKEDSIVNMVAPEVWVKIFHFAYQKRASPLRLVCKSWRDVFNDNYEIKAILNDETTELPCFFQYRRVTACTVVHFRKDTQIQQSLQLFQDPSVLTKLTILGKITRGNFLFLVEQCTNVQELIITGASLETEAKLFEGETLEENIVLKMFIGKLRKLVITGAYFDDDKKDPGSIGFTFKNMITLFGYEMPNLTTFVVRVNSSRFLGNDILGFIEKCDELKHVDIYYRTNGWLSKQSSIIQISQIDQIELEKSTLASLKIRVDTVNELIYWLPLIKIQRRLEVLHIRLGCNRDCDFVDVILDVIRKNEFLKDIQVDVL